MAYGAVTKPPSAAAPSAQAQAAKARAAALLSAPLLGHANDLVAAAAHEAGHAVVALALGYHVRHLSACGESCITRPAPSGVDGAAIALAGALGENRDLLLRAVKCDDLREVQRLVSPGDWELLVRDAKLGERGSRWRLREGETLALLCLGVNRRAHEAFKSALLRTLYGSLDEADVAALWAVYGEGGD